MYTFMLLYKFRLSICHKIIIFCFRLPKNVPHCNPVYFPTNNLQSNFLETQRSNLAQTPINTEYSTIIVFPLWCQLKMCVCMCVEVLLHISIEASVWHQNRIVYSNDCWLRFSIWNQLQNISPKKTNKKNCWGKSACFSLNPDILIVNLSSKLTKQM